MDIIQKLSEELSIRPSQAEAAVKLLDEGNTVPFIARYRKEATGSTNSFARFVKGSLTCAGWKSAKRRSAAPFPSKEK